MPAEGLVQLPIQGLLVRSGRDRTNRPAARGLPSAWRKISHANRFPQEMLRSRRLSIRSSSELGDEG
jgi:hypothetical protein